MLPLKLDDVSFAAGNRTIIDRLSLQLDAGPATIVLGPNGAGKSVFLRLCHGLLEPTAGRVSWLGRRALGSLREQAMVFQKPVMLRRSALANITYGLEIAGVSRHARLLRAGEMLNAVGLAHLSGKPARVLSGGEQQRLALARAWALSPEILFLDEPTASLDPGATREVEAIIGSIRSSGTKIVMTTHNLAQARRLGDEIVFLNGGRLQERSSVEHFFNHPATAQAAAFIRGELPWN